MTDSAHLSSDAIFTTLAIPVTLMFVTRMALNLLAVVSVTGMPSR